MGYSPWVRGQMFDIQDGGMFLWTQLGTLFRYSLTWAGSHQMMPTVVVDSKQNKCRFNQKWLISASYGVTLLCQTWRGIKTVRWVATSYCAAAVVARDQNQSGKMNVWNGWQRASNTCLRTSYRMEHDYITQTMSLCGEHELLPDLWHLTKYVYGTSGNNPVSTA